MKTLLVLRHAKSDRSNDTLRDHDRPLAPRGEADAPRMGAALAALDMIPDCIVTSTAVRARETAHLVAAAMGYGGAVIEEAGSLRRIRGYAARRPARHTATRLQPPCSSGTIRGWKTSSAC